MTEHEKQSLEFMKLELKRVQDREFEIFKGRNTILQLMFLSTSGIIAAIGVLFRYKGDNEFTLLITGILIILIPIIILFNYLRLVNNTGELSISRIQKFLAQISLKDYSPDYYPKFDLYPSTGKSYNPISQVSGFTPKTMKFYKILILSTCIIIGIGVVGSELFIIQNIKLFDDTPIVKNIKPIAEQFDWLFFACTLLFGIYLSRRLIKSLNKHKEEVENVCKFLLNKFERHDMLEDKTVEQYFDWWNNYGETQS